MSHIHLEPVGFPWIPILITFVSIILMGLIAKWVVAYAMWMFGHLKWSGGGVGDKKKKKVPPRKQKKKSESEDDEEPESSSEE